MSPFKNVGPNDLMFEGSPGYAAAHYNVEVIGFIAIALTMAFAYWVGSQGTGNKTVNTIAVAGMLALSIFAGTLLGLQGGIIIMLYMAIAGAAGYYVGHRRFKQSQEK